MKNVKTDVDFVYICKVMNAYEKLTSLDIQNKLKPIIKHFGVNYLSECTGISKHYLHRICKKLFVENNEKVSFETYVRIVTMTRNTIIASNKELNFY